MIYQRRLDGAISEHTTIKEALSESFSKISFTVDEHSRLILWNDGTWMLRTVEGAWDNGKFQTWKEIGVATDRKIMCYNCYKEVTLISCGSHSIGALHSICPICGNCPDCDDGE
jgi:hypothetical protein